MAQSMRHRRLKRGSGPVGTWGADKIPPPWGGQGGGGGGKPPEIVVNQKPVGSGQAAKSRAKPAAKKPTARKKK